MELNTTEGGGQFRARDKRAYSLGAGAATAALLLAIALVFSTSFGAARVAENARELHWTNASLGAVAISRASNSQAVLFALDHQIGVASADAAELATSEARTNLEAARNWASAAGTEPPRVTLEQLDDALTRGAEVIDLIEAGEPDRAAEVANGAFETAYRTVELSLGTYQNEVSARIDATEAVAGRIAWATRALVVLIIPVAAMIIYRQLAKRQLQRRRLAMDAKLEAERELVAAKDEFIAGISHELRTPLTTIYGFSEVLVEEGIVDPAAAMELISLINSESSELSRMVEDLLTAARIDASALLYNVETFDAAAEVETVVTPLQRTGVSVDVTLPQVMVRADRVRFRQIVRNLVANANKHGGPEIQVEIRQDETDLICTVTDNGPGVPAEAADRLFTRFFHAGKEALLVGSVGLGLAVSKSLAVAMNGDLTYRRDDGKTIFILQLPCLGMAAKSTLESAGFDPQVPEDYSVGESAPGNVEQPSRP